MSEVFLSIKMFFRWNLRLNADISSKLFAAFSSLRCKEEHICHSFFAAETTSSLPWIFFCLRIHQKYESILLRHFFCRLKVFFLSCHPLKEAAKCLFFSQGNFFGSSTWSVCVCVCQCVREIKKCVEERERESVCVWERERV